MHGPDWFAILDECEMGAVTDSLRKFPQDDLVPLEVATWRERVRHNWAVADEAAEVAARAAVNVIASAVETDANTRQQLFLYICSRVKAEQ